MSLVGYEDYIAAGKIAAKATEIVAAKITPGSSALEVALFCDNLISELGGKPGFPVNLSVNDVAAHYTPVPGNDLVFQEGDLVKVDVGVQVNGYLADTAVTVCVGKKGHPLIEAAEDALAAAEKALRPGVPVSEIGEAIEAAIVSRGFKPIYNLTGHTVEQWNLHAGKSVPNFKGMKGALSAPCAVAIEPFATTGDGYVSDGPASAIFSVTGRQTRLPQARAILAKLASRFSTLPFSSRWLSPAEISVIPQLVKGGSLFNYAVLRERSRAPVAQAEHTFLITEDGKVVVTTRR